LKTAISLTDRIPSVLQFGFIRVIFLNRNGYMFGKERPMSSDGQRKPLLKAYEITLQWIELLYPFCNRIALGGSIRRKMQFAQEIQKAFTVGDGEIVLIPKLSVINDLFGNLTMEVNTLETMLPHFVRKHNAVFKQNGPRKKKIYLLEHDFCIDIWICLPPAQWGVNFVLRTGPAEFNHWIVTKRDVGGKFPTGYVMKDAGIYKKGQLIPMAEEIDFLTFLGLGWIEPKDRKAPDKSW
jgi:DNA polymerase/3'-5' exonuclease PolX